jgi:outer membrane protein insertion porin family
MSNCGRGSRGRPGAAGALLGAALALVCLALVPRTGLSQETAAAVVARLEFQVDGRPAGPEASSLVSLRPGLPYTLKAVQDAVRQLYASGLYSSVEAVRSGGARVTLTFRLKSLLAVRSVGYRAPAGVSTLDLTPRLTVLRPGAEFRPDLLPRAEAEVRDMLKRDGYFGSEVRAEVARDPAAPSTVDITYEISAGARYIIDGVNFAGESPIPLADIRKRISLHPGKPYVPAGVDKDRAAVVDLFRARGYRQAAVTLEGAAFHDAEGTVTLTLRLDPGERVDIVIRGAKVPVSLLAPIWEEHVFEEWGLQEGEARILSYLRKKGYLFAIVSSSIEHPDHVLRVIHDVDPGTRYRIRSLVFEGMTHFTVTQLRSLLGLEEGLFSFGIIDGQRVFELPREIENLYRTQGYSRAAVNLDFFRKARAVTAIFAVKEGPQQRIQDVTISGASAFPEARLLTLIESRPGGAFYRPRAERDAETIKAFYLNEGFRGTTVGLSDRKAGDDLTSVVFSVEEGRRVRVGRIILNGLRVTRPSTVLRELSIKEGDEAREGVILDSERNVERLGIFADVSLEEVPVEPGIIDLVFQFQEGGRNYAGLGLGVETGSDVSSPTAPRGDISPRVTAEYIRSNVFGDASQLSLSGQFSLREKRAVLAFEERYIFGLPMQNSLNALLERVALPSFTFDRQGLSFNAINPLFRDVVLLTTLTYARTTLQSLSVAENTVDRVFFPYSKTSISNIITWDRRDDPYNPTRGSFASGALEWAYPLFGSESNFQKVYLKFQDFEPLGRGVGFAGTLRLGFGRGVIPIHERFFAGGSNSFRGEHFDKLGPLDPVSGQPVGGKLLTLLNLELTVPFPVAIENLSWVFFYDIGNVFASRADFSLAKMENAVGFGLRYRTPLGPLRLEVGLNLNPPGAGRKVIPFITIGEIF